MQTKHTFTTHRLGQLTLSNRIVMAPMTRSRAIGNIPNETIAEYYAQRASAGLIVTEGTSPSPSGLGYSRIPGIFSNEQTDAWKQVTKAVHEKGGKIFLQLMHTGRISHPHNLPAGARVLAPSSIRPVGQMWTDQEGMLDFPVPQELTLEEIKTIKSDFVQAAVNAVEAEFDGIELHGANGYLLEQFLSPHSNQRTDNYGGSIENRSRFVLELAAEISDFIGRDKVGVRFSPYGIYNDMPYYQEVDATYSYLAEKLNQTGIAYLHVVDHSSAGTPEVPLRIKETIREKFANTIILTGGYNLQQAEHGIASGLADLIGFGKPFINNPDLPVRLERNYPLNAILDFSTFFTAGVKGYTDYPVYAEESVSV